jgi:hypothetical protein
MACAMADGTAVLIVIQGRDPGSRFRLPENRVTSIGRSSQNRISLVNPTISRFHCEIAFSNGDWYLTDLNSKAGTRLNGRHMRNRKRLDSGDVIRIGSTVLKFEFAEEDPRKDESILALQGAVMDAELKSKGESVASFEDMRQRSQFAVNDEFEDEQEGLLAPETKDVLINTFFVVGTAIMVALVTFGVIFPRYLSIKEQWRVHRNTLEKARKAYAKAEAKADQATTSIQDALDSLRAVATKYASTPQAQKAHQKIRELRTSYAERKLSRIAEMEAEGRYGDAISAYDKMLDILKAPRMIALVKQRRKDARTLAETALEDVHKRAQRAELRRRKTEAAIEVYEKASERIGVTSVQEKIDKRIQQLSSKESG